MTKSLIAAIALLSACASFGPTPYQSEAEANKVFGGYREQVVGPGKFLVGFRGNGYTSKATAEQYAFQRAKEICVGQGFKMFDMISKTDASTQHRTPSNVSCTNFGGIQKCTDHGGGSYERPDVELLITCVN